jgi:hypothetical protein
MIRVRLRSPAANQTVRTAVQWRRPGDHPAVRVINSIMAIPGRYGPQQVTPGCWIVDGPKFPLVLSERGMWEQYELV